MRRRCAVHKESIEQMPVGCIIKVRDGRGETYAQIMSHGNGFLKCCKWLRGGGWKSTQQKIFYQNVVDGPMNPGHTPCTGVKQPLSATDSHVLVGEGT